MKFIGITGGIGAGKSTVLSLLKENFNCKVVLADEVAAQLMTSGHKCFDEVVALNWPTSILDESGEIDRPLMAKYMFADEELLSGVNAIVHPAVEKEVLNQVEEEKEKHNIEYFFLEAALLIECGYGKLVDEMWYIYASPEVREIRLMESRGYSKERIANTFKVQRSDASFREHCDHVIDNSGTEEETLSQLRALL
ncbi:dephospho-CoA kinase [Pseudobutyrivibrio xylanivorans]|uniref:Dephospho-CoA kinase n=1 Tax=Pseudobutyrivibrio xylanivorans TaxID=185007 RepID=A0A1G5S392_PSEXY|nr:dephospho-CoA kinase [Pseudobutyrivibrio xylanivorans]SCZ80310.1 dephospho-CoA kinase [Pseudobutyrivibrio xylanivorans]